MKFWKTPGKGFGGAVRYLFTGRRDQPSDKQAELLGSKGVSTNSVAGMIADFELGRDVNPRVNVAVWHASLSFNPDDEARLNNARMLAIAEGFLHKMGMDNTQYIIVRHHDSPDNQHLHIVANRVNNEGKSIVAGQDFYRADQALKELIAEHGLTPPGERRPALQHPERFRPVDLARYQMLAVIDPAMRQETQRPQLLANLKEVGISSQLHYNLQGKATGISFEKDGYCLKGSALGPHLSLAEIDKQLAANELKQRAETHASAVAAARPSQPLKGLVSAVETPSSSAVTVKSAEPDKAPTQSVPVGAGALDATSGASSSAAAEVKSTVLGQELSAELQDVQSGIVQKMESGLAAEKSTAAVPIPAAQAALPPTVESAMTGEAAVPLPVRPRQDAAEPVTGKATPLQTPAGADTSSSTALTELPVPRTVGPNERMSSADSLTAAEAATQLNPGRPPAPTALPALSLAEMLVSTVPDLPNAPAESELPTTLIPAQQAATMTPESPRRVVAAPAAGAGGTAVAPPEADKQMPAPPVMDRTPAVPLPEHSVQLPVPASGAVLPPTVVAADPPVGEKGAAELPAGRSPLGRMVPADPTAATPPVETVAQPPRSAPGVSTPAVVTPPTAVPLSASASLPANVAGTAPSTVANVAWQHGVIRMRATENGTGEARLSNVRAALVKVGATVGEVVPPAAAGSTVALLAYSFDPASTRLDEVNKLLLQVEASCFGQKGRTGMVREQLHPWHQPGVLPEADSLKWPEREGQFNQAQILVTDPVRGQERAGNVAKALRGAGATVSETTRDDQGRFTMQVCYHTCTPTINDIDTVLAKVAAPALLGMEVKETEQHKEARLSGIMVVAERQKENDNYISI
jgi:hypothetical protein